MFLEGSRWRKFSQLMADHVFSHKHRVENLAVVHQERVPDKVRGNHGPARPGLDRSFCPGIGFLDFFEELDVHERTFFQ
jgi:hypothetical protein